MKTTVATEQTLISYLSDPASYPEHPEHVKHIQTHISDVFLTGRYAYKLKKPVRFDFLDFTTLAARHRACREEVRLNRRLAADVYLEVIPVTRSRSGGFQLGGNGEIEDWLVKMRQLPANRALDYLICQGELTDADRLRLTVVLTSFYEQVPPLTLTTDACLRRLDQHVRENMRVLLDVHHRAPAQVVRSIHSSQLRALVLGEAMFRRRVMDGRILDGHGDLRPEHVYLTWPPAIIDCIEFNREFRQIDVVDELSFFAMECEHLGDAGVGASVLSAYREQSGDDAADALVSFYKSYRACVRAKVLLLRRDQLDHPHEPDLDEAIAKYLELGQRYARDLGAPHVIAVGGLMGSGKSTLATALAQTLGCEVLHSDSVRCELFGHHGREVDYGQGKYDLPSRRRVYGELHRHAERLLDAGTSVILDATYSRNEHRQAVLELATRRNAVPLLVHCECPDDIAVQRIRRRMEFGDSDSDGRPSLLAAQRMEFQPPNLKAPVIAIDSTKTVGELELKVIARMRELISLD